MDSLLPIPADAPARPFGTLSSERTRSLSPSTFNQNNMKKVLLVLMLVMGCCTAGAQTIRDGSYSMIGVVDKDGIIRDRSYSMIGKLDSDGTIRNSSYSMIGKIDSDGTIRNSSYSAIGYVYKDGSVKNSSYSTIGHIDRDGTVRNSSYSSIGHAEGVKPELAAALFFFELIRLK